MLLLGLLLLAIGLVVYWMAPPHGRPIGQLVAVVGAVVLVVWLVLLVASSSHTV